jgi:AcrR family transcriptional regulator
MVYRATARVVARKADVRRRILVAARELVASGGFAAATVSAVATRAELATGTVYRYFPSKGELLAEVFRAASGREVDVMREVARGPGPADERLAAAIRQWSRRAIAGRTLAYALIAEPVGPEVDAERLVYRRAYADVMAELIREGVEERRFTVADPQIAAAALVGALSEALVGPLAPNDDRLTSGAQTIIGVVIDLCLRAVGATSHVHA